MPGIRYSVTRVADSRYRRGAALVEASLLLILLFTIFAACVDFGRYFLTQVSLNNAARGGARYAAGNSTDLPGVVNTVINEMSSSSLLPSLDRLSVGSPTTSGGVTTYPINVTVPSGQTIVIGTGKVLRAGGSGTTFANVAEVSISSEADGTSLRNTRMVVRVLYGFTPTLGRLAGIGNKTIYAEAKMIRIQ